jgi:hypothetical protein
MFSWFGLVSLVFAIWIGGNARAEAVSIFGGGGTPRAALIGAPKTAVRDVSFGASSLFIGRGKGGLFVDRDEAAPAFANAAVAGMSGRAVQMIRHIIGQAESSRAGYDAVQHGARIKPPRLPTQMKVADIFKWIEATPGQPHAIGRYQFIPQTLRRLMRKLDLSAQQRFSPDLQDKLADVLLAEAGYHKVKSGQLSRHAFMNNLAKIWAGLPNDTGRSHYDGYAGNKASMTWAQYDAQMVRVFVQ